MENFSLPTQALKYKATRFTVPEVQYIGKTRLSCVSFVLDVEKEWGERITPGVNFEFCLMQ